MTEPGLNADDDEAKKVTEQLVDGQDVELWRRRRDSGAASNSAWPYHPQPVKFIEPNTAGRLNVARAALALHSPPCEGAMHRPYARPPQPRWRACSALSLAAMVRDRT